tara:strand:+ start:5043 stop:9422 length:4380 start_codon:yes stop_codon:yes gene_type:complete
MAEEYSTTGATDTPYTDTSNEMEEVAPGVYRELFVPRTVQYSDMSASGRVRGMTGEPIDEWDRTEKEARKLLLPWLGDKPKDKLPNILFPADKPADEEGFYPVQFYSNGAGKLENVYNMTKSQAAQEVAHRESIRKNVGTPYYFIESDQTRYQAWKNGNPDPRAKSTEKRDFRMQSTVSALLMGTQATSGQLKFGGEDKGIFSPSIAEVNEPSSSILNPTGLGATVARGFVETANIAFGAGNAMIAGLQELEKGMRFNIFMQGKPTSVAPKDYISPDEAIDNVYFPTMDEINDMLIKPEGDMVNQFASIITPGIMTSGLLTGVVGTFRNGKKIFARASKETLKQMRDEGIPSFKKLVGPERVLAERDFLEKMRRQLNDRLEKEIGSNYLKATGLRKMITKGRFDAHVNPKKWLLENGFAEVGVTTGMVLAHRHLADSNDPNDSFRLFGMMNTGIGIVGAFVSGSGPAAITGMGEKIGISSLIRAGIQKYRPGDYEAAMAAVEEIATGGKGMSGALNNLKPKHRKRVLQMVDDIYQIKDPKVREEIIDSARESQQVIADLIKMNPTDAEWIKTVHISLGQMFKVSNLMAAEEYLIRTARGGGTVSFSIVDASSQIYMKRVQAARSLEGLLEKSGAMDISGLEPETKAFLNNVRRMSSDMSMDNAANSVKNKNFIETGLEVSLAKMHVGSKVDVKEIQEFDKMIAHYGNALDGMTNEVEKAAGLKRMQILIEQKNAIKLSKIQERLNTYPNTPAGASSAAQRLIHENGVDKLSTASKNYTIAKNKLAGVELTGESADDYFLGLADALKFTGQDNIVNRNVNEVQNAIESAIDPIAKDILDDVLRTLEPDDAGFKALKKAITTVRQGSSNLDIITMLIKAKQAGEGVGPIPADVLDNLNIKMDYLDIDSLNQLVNQQITGLKKGLNNDGVGRVKSSALQQFFDKHNNAYKDWENSVGKEVLDASGLKEAKKYYKEVVLPATYNNKLWTAIKTTKDAGDSLNYEKAFTYLDDVKVMSDPDEFLLDATRAFGKFNPEKGIHVLDDAGKEIVGNLLTNYIGAKIAVQSKKVSNITKLKPTSAAEIAKSLDQFKDDATLEGLNLTNLEFGNGFDQSLIDNLNVLDTALNRVGLNGIVDGAIFAPRDYNNILKTNKEAQDSFIEATNVIKGVERKYKPKLASLQKQEDIFVKEIERLSSDAGGIKSSGDFYEKLIVQNQGELLGKLKKGLTKSIGNRKARMSVAEFDEIVRRQVASGIRKLSEEGAIQLEKRAGALGLDDQKMVSRVSGAKLLSNLQNNSDTLKQILGEDHFNHMKIVGRVLEIIQRAPVSADSPEVLKASKMTIGGMTSRLYAVFSGRVSWRYVGAEALFLNMAKNDAYAITAILANPEATKAIAYMAVTGKPIINKITTTDKMTAWIPEVFIASSDQYRDQWERAWEEDRYIRREKDRVSKEKVGKQMEELFVGS